MTMLTVKELSLRHENNFALIGLGATMAAFGAGGYYIHKWFGKKCNRCTRDR